MIDCEITLPDTLQNLDFSELLPEGVIWYGSLKHLIDAFNRKSKMLSTWQDFGFQVIVVIEQLVKDIGIQIQDKKTKPQNFTKLNAKDSWLKLLEHYRKHSKREGLVMTSRYSVEENGTLVITEEPVEKEVTKIERYELRNFIAHHCYSANQFATLRALELFITLLSDFKSYYTIEKSFEKVVTSSRPTFNFDVDDINLHRMREDLKNKTVQAFPEVFQSDGDVVKISPAFYSSRLQSASVLSFLRELQSEVAVPILRTFASPIDERKLKGKSLSEIEKILLDDQLIKMALPSPTSNHVELQNDYKTIVFRMLITYLTSQSMLADYISMFHYLSPEGSYPFLLRLLISYTFTTTRLLQLCQSNVDKTVRPANFFSFLITGDITVNGDIRECYKDVADPRTKAEKSCKDDDEVYTTTLTAFDTSDDKSFEFEIMGVEIKNGLKVKSISPYSQCTIAADKADDLIGCKELPLSESRVKVIGKKEDLCNISKDKERKIGNFHAAFMKWKCKKRSGTTKRLTLVANVKKNTLHVALEGADLEDITLL